MEVIIVGFVNFHAFSHFTEVWSMIMNKIRDFDMNVINSVRAGVANFAIDAYFANELLEL